MMQLNRVEKRDSLPPRREPYFESLGNGRSLGYRVMTKGDTTGTWIARVRREGRYEQSALGDFASLPAKERYHAAKRDAETWFEHLQNGGVVKSGTVADACRAYLAKMRNEARHEEGQRDPVRDAEERFKRLVFGGPRKSTRVADSSSAYAPDPIADIELAKLTKAHMSGWRGRVLATHKPATFNRNATSLRAALNQAKADGKVATDQAWLVALQEIKGVGKRRELYLDAAQRKLLLACADDEARPFFTLLNMLPFRPGEAASLKAGSFNPKTGELRIGRGKTKARIIMLGSAAQAFLRECAKDKLPGAWLVNRANGEQWINWKWRDAIVLAVARAHLPRKTVALTLRHSVITDLIVGGLDIFHVAKLAGTSVKMIEEHYGHLQQAHAQEALDRLAQLAVG